MNNNYIIGWHVILLCEAAILCIGRIAQGANRGYLKFYPCPRPCPCPRPRKLKPFIPFI